MLHKGPLKEKLFALKHFIDYLNWRSVKPQDYQAIRLSLDYLDTFRVVRKFSRFQRHISRSSELFLNYADTFPRSSNLTETFQIIHTLYRTHFLD